MINNSHDGSQLSKPGTHADGTEPAGNRQRPRSPKDGPFCWASKGVLRLIRQALDDSSCLDQALALYLAHCEVASDEQSPVYDVLLRKLAQMSGVSISQVKVLHPKFEAMGILGWTQNHIEGTKEKAASTFTLYPPPACTRPTSAPGKRRSARAQKAAGWLDKEESPQESFEQSPQGRCERKAFSSECDQRNPTRFRTEKIDPKML